MAVPNGLVVSIIRYGDGHICAAYTSGALKAALEGQGFAIFSRTPASNLVVKNNDTNVDSIAADKIGDYLFLRAVDNSEYVMYEIVAEDTLERPYEGANGTVSGIYITPDKKRGSLLSSYNEEWFGK